jgi:hypothetical protein
MRKGFRVRRTVIVAEGSRATPRTNDAPIFRAKNTMMRVPPIPSVAVCTAADLVNARRMERLAQKRSHTSAARGFARMACVQIVAPKAWPVAAESNVVRAPATMERVATWVVRTACAWLGVL